MKAMSRMSPPQLGHLRENSSPTRAISFGQRNPGGVVGAGLSRESQRSPLVSPPAAASRHLPEFPMASAVTAHLSL
jgi:hypothetical protein